MTTIVTRAGKGSALTHNEVDTNFTNLNSAKYESGNNATLGTIQGSTITATTGFSGNLTGNVTGDVSGNAGTVTNGVYTTGNQTIGGTKTFSSTILGNLTGDTSGAHNGTVGATTPAAGTFTSLSDSGNLTFTGTGNRIRGDFSNATLGDRFAFQNSATNQVTRLLALPNGTATASSIDFINTSDTTSALALRVGMSSTEATIQSTRLTGAASYLPMTFYTSGSERMRIDSSGNVGIGTASPSNKLHVSATSQNDADGLIRAENTTASTVNASLTAKNYYGTSQFMQWENNGLRIGSRITTNGGNGNVIFTAGADTERMRIDSSGNVLVGTTSVVQNGKQTIVANLAVSTGFVVQNTNTPQNFFAIFANSSSNIAGSISHSGSTTVAFNTSSDYRLKENIAPMQNALATVIALKPCTYKWKEDGSDGQGFIAHELQELVPDCVTGEKDAVDAEGKPVYQGIDTSFLVATLTAAIQEQQAIITDLKARIEVLENK
jgi:hypothetical protein